MGVIGSLVANVLQLTGGGVINHKIMNEPQNLNIALNFLRSDEPRFWLGAVIGCLFIN